MKLDNYFDPRHHARGGKWSTHADDIARNFPACVLYLSADDIIDSLPTRSWTCRATGNVFTFASDLDNESDPAEISSVSGGSTATGSLAITGSSYGFGIWAGNFTDSNSSLLLGTESLGHMKIMQGASGRAGAGTMQHIATDAVSPAVAAYAGGVHSMYVRGDTVEQTYGTIYKTFAERSVGTKSVAIEDEAGMGGTDGTTGCSTYAGPTSRIVMPDSESSVKIIVLFQFATPPVQKILEIATGWMAHEDAYTNGWLYPGLAGMV